MLVEHSIRKPSGKSVVYLGNYINMPKGVFRGILGPEVEDSEQ